MSIRDDVILSLEVHGDIEFIYQNKHYHINYNMEKESSDGYCICQTPDNDVALSDSSNWLEALDEPIFEGKTMNDVFEDIKFTFLT